MKKLPCFGVVAVVTMMALASTAQAFGVSFASWGSFPRCSSGTPFSVPSPKFSVSGVPAGTVKLKFSMRDLNVAYNHGGGAVNFDGGSSVAAGAFHYECPCPPDGAHNYKWTVLAVDAKGKTLGKATTTKRYP